MPSRHDPTDSLRYLIENADRVARYIAGMDQAEFEKSESIRDAVERCIERVCEAAHRLGPYAEARMPDQPWSEIRGMGNRLRHAYDRIDVGIVCNTALLRLPQLAGVAKQALAGLNLSTEIPET